MSFAIDELQDAYAGTAVFGGDSKTQPKAMKPTPTTKLTVAKTRKRNVNSHVKTVRFAIVYEPRLRSSGFLC